MLRSHRGEFTFSPESEARRRGRHVERVAKAKKLKLQICTSRLIAKRRKKKNMCYAVEQRVHKNCGIWDLFRRVVLSALNSTRSLWSVAQENVRLFPFKMRDFSNGAPPREKKAYRAPLKGGPVLLSTTQAGPGWNFSQPKARLLGEPCSFGHLKSPAPFVKAISLNNLFTRELLIVDCPQEPFCIARNNIMLQP